MVAEALQAGSTGAEGYPFSLELGVREAQSNITDNSMAMAGAWRVFK